MKRLICTLLCCALLILVPVGFADYEGEPQQCISLSLAGNASTGYQWMAISSDETVAYVDDLGITESGSDTHLLGAPEVRGYRICGAQAGSAEIQFTYSRPWESKQMYCFTIPVAVDESLNVTGGSEITLPAVSGGWQTDAERGDILEVTPQEMEGDSQRFALTALTDGYDALRFHPANGENMESFTFQFVCKDDVVNITEITFRFQEEDAPFAPEFLFTTTDFFGETVTEQIFAGHNLTILNFWEPWCGPCVSEMPALEQISQDYAAQGVQVIGVYSTPNAEADVQTVLDYTGVTYPILRYTNDFDFLQTGYVPTTVIIGSSGNIVKSSFAGALDYDGWAELIEELL